MVYHANKRMGTYHDWAVIVLLWALAASIAAFAYTQLIDWADGARVKRTVYSVCEYTRMTSAHEDVCGIAQDASQTEYICNGNLTTSDCWIEDKR